jgi:hypothetical protein
VIDPDLTKKFFLESESDQLTRIYQWARARYAAPWAVFGAVLLRVSASTGPDVQLPGVIGGRASLNMMAVFVAASGGGKGISDATARLAWPADIHEEGLGSGQGISELFKETKNPEDRISRAIFMVPEIDHLAALDAGQGNNTRATLKAAIMGERLGSKGASSATSRMVAPHTYRMCLSVAGQFGHCGVILDDATGGTPQRTLWFPSTDPQMPGERSADPGPLDTGIPLWAPGADEVVEIAYGPAEITETIIAAHLARQRGDGDALDGHAMLVRCKVAAILAIMHHRSVVSEQDWELSAIVMEVSDATRQTVIEHARQAAKAKVRERAIARAVGDEVYDSRLLDGVRTSILRTLERDGEQAGNELRSKMGKRDRRDMFDQAIALLQHEGLVTSMEVARGTRYRLALVQGEPAVQGAYQQFKEGEPKVQGEPPATVTDLDSRRSHESERPKLSCQRWFNHHVEQLIAAGETLAESFAVITAGQAAGYTKHQIHTAASAHPTLKALGRGQWSITGEHNPYPSADDFITTYLNQLPANTTEVDRDHFRAAGEADGYAWEALRKAIRNQPRITSTMGPNAAWRITPATTDTAEEGTA